MARSSSTMSMLGILRRPALLTARYHATLRFRILNGRTPSPRLHRGITMPLLVQRRARNSPRPPKLIITRPHKVILGGLLGFFWGSRDEEDKVPAFVKRKLLTAQRALREGDYEAAGGAYHDALKRLATSEHSSAQAYVEARAVVLDKLANMYLEQGMWDQAQVTFKEAMRFMLTAGMEQESEAMVEISLKLSKIYTNQKRYELADAGFDWCVNTAQKLYTTSKTENNTALWGMCLHSKGQYHLATGDWESAVQCLTEALKLSTEVFDSSHLQVAVMHNDLATALDAHGQYTQAEYHAQASLDIMSHSHAVHTAAVDVESWARVYYNLGMILRHQGKTSEARSAFAKALDKAGQLQDKSLEKHVLQLLEH